MSITETRKAQSFANILQFSKTQLLSTSRGIVCDGKQCEEKIMPAHKYWRAGKDSGLRMCQKCFGFMLSRYSMNDNGYFVYNPFDIDKKDQEWEVYFNEQWVRQTLEAFTLSL